MTPGQHLPPDHSKGDESTVGGYAAVHARPAALEGTDGMSYSLEILVDTTDDPTPDRTYGAYFLFVQWTRVGEQGVSGHLESDFLAWGATAATARRALGAMPLRGAQAVLDALVRARDGVSARRWFDVTHRRGRSMGGVRAVVLSGTGGTWAVRTNDGVSGEASLRGPPQAGGRRAETRRRRRGDTRTRRR